MLTKKHNAFTLAEILITLSIIGVIAALTIPALNSYTKQLSYITALKKAFSVVNQAYSMISMDNSRPFRECATNDSECLVNLLKPYLSYTKTVSGTGSSKLPGCWDNDELLNAGEQHVCMLTNDGMAFDFDMEWTNCSPLCAFVSVDVNGLKDPNTWGKDRYRFVIYPDRVSLNTETAPDQICDDGRGPWTNNTNCAYKYLKKN